MADMFSLNLKDQKHLLQVFQRAPQKLQRATAGFLNTYAFRARKDQIAQIHRTMTVRNERFVASKIRVNKTRGNIPINAMAADVGSVRGPRFTGWREQQDGVGQTRNRKISTHARGGDNKKQVQQKARLKSSANFHRVQEFRRGNHTTYGQGIVSMMIAARQGKLKRPFLINQGGGPGKLSRFRKGLYSNQGRNIVRLQSFNESPRKTRVTQWHTKAISISRGRLNKRRIWEQQMKFVFKL